MNGVRQSKKGRGWGLHRDVGEGAPQGRFTVQGETDGCQYQAGTVKANF
jgi:hypothetical protein